MEVAAFSIHRKGKVTVRVLNRYKGRTSESGREESYGGNKGIRDRNQQAVVRH